MEADGMITAAVWTLQGEREMKRGERSCPWHVHGISEAVKQKSELNRNINRGHLICAVPTDWRSRNQEEQRNTIRLLSFLQNIL